MDPDDLPDDYSLVLDLLDNQVVDGDGLPIGRVDDVEIDVAAGGPPTVTGLLVGAEALGLRIGGLTGTLMHTTAARLRPAYGQGSGAHSGPPSVPVALVGELRPLVRLRVPLASLPGFAGLERWLAAHVVGPLTGARDESH